MRKILLVAMLSIFSTTKPISYFDLCYGRSNLTTLAKLTVSAVLSYGILNIAERYLPTTTILLLGLAANPYDPAVEPLFAPDIEPTIAQLAPPAENDPLRIQFLANLQGIRTTLAKIRYFNIMFNAGLWVHVLIFNEKPIKTIAILILNSGLGSSILNHFCKEDIHAQLQDELVIAAEELDDAAWEAQQVAAA